MDKNELKSNELFRTNLDHNNNPKTTPKETNDETNKSVQKAISPTNFAYKLSNTNVSTSTNQKQINTFNTNHVPRKTSKSDSSCPNQLPFRNSPEHRKFSLSTLTSNAADRLMQRKSSLQPQPYHQFQNQNVLPNFMGLFLAEDQQQLISSEPQSNTTTCAKVTTKQESISNYLQRKTSRTNQQTMNTSSITNLSSFNSSTLTGNKKKYSEPLLPGLLREELTKNLLFTQNLNSTIDDANNTSLINESVTASCSGNENVIQLSDFDIIPNLVPNLVTNSTASPITNIGNGKRRTTLSSLIATNRSIGTVSGYRSNNSLIEQESRTFLPVQDSHLTQSTNLSTSNMNNQTNFLHYLPFRRFSKRAQSDPWIGERLIHRLPYTGNRRFTLGTTTDNLFQSEEEVSII